MCLPDICVLVPFRVSFLVVVNMKTVFKLMVIPGLISAYLVPSLQDLCEGKSRIFLRVAHYKVLMS